MTSQLEYGKISHPEEAQRLGDILTQSFNGHSSDWSYYANNIGQENFRVIRRAGEVAGGLAMLQLGQWFGAQLVPMAGIASVAVPPEHRGTGLALELLSQTLKELYSIGVPLSTLYAATQRPYRKVGYEQAGICCGWELPTESIRINASQAMRDIPIIRAPLQPEIFQKLHQKWAIQNNGNLHRNQGMWQLLMESQNEQIVYAYLIGSKTQPEGYVIFNQQANTDYNLAIRDWVALTPAANIRLLMFLSDHRSLAEKVMWRGASFDPMLLLLPEQTQRVRFLDRWMLRIVNVPKALEKRGYPLGVEAELHLDVQDDLLVENSGQFILTVADGKGEVTKGGKGELQLNVRALAPLYTGLFTSHQLQLTGQISANDHALNVATQLFRSSEPWMPDKF